MIAMVWMKWEDSWFTYIYIICTYTYLLVRMCIDYLCICVDGMGENAASFVTLISILH
jgi:hypothetical protein